VYNFAIGGSQIRPEARHEVPQVVRSDLQRF